MPEAAHLHPPYDSAALDERSLVPRRIMMLMIKGGGHGRIGSTLCSWKCGNRVFVIMEDGEINEGSVWEAAMCAGKHKLSHLSAIIDYNKIQLAGFTRDIQDLEPLADKWRAFNFEVAEVDGHDVNALRKTFSALPLHKDKPSAIICHTVKGKGIPFAENDPKWHHQSSIKPEVYAQMKDALKARRHA